MQGKTQFLQKKECCAGALEGQLIATLCKLTGAKTVLEVGMFTGTTTLAMAQALPDDGQVSSALPAACVFAIDRGHQARCSMPHCMSAGKAAPALHACADLGSLKGSLGRCRCMRAR